MSTPIETSPEPTTRVTAAALAARERWARNVAALAHTDPDLARAMECASLIPGEVEWVFGRDGALTALTSDGRWLSGCSLPRRAAMQQLRKLELAGPVGCFLAPPHASSIGAGLARLSEEQALIALVPAAADLAWMLRCEDFSAHIESRRLFFVTGPDWPLQLDALYTRYHGLCVPTQFIRLPSADPELIRTLINEAQGVFSAVTARRTEELGRIVHAPAAADRRSLPARVCVVAPSVYRLSYDWGHVLRTHLRSDSGVQLHLLDPDDPCSASPLAVARAANACDAILTVDRFRFDAPGIVSGGIRWLTLAANGRIAPPVAAEHLDVVIVLDERAAADARTAGWHEHLIVTARLPEMAQSPAPQPAYAAILADTGPLEPPDSIDDYSSHRPLWESIAAELSSNPSALGRDPEEYLDSRLRRCEVAESTVNRAMLHQRLIASAYQHGLARVLLSGGCPLRLFGSGWDCVESFRPHLAGPLRTREQFVSALDASAVVIHPWPGGRPHTVDCTGRPVVRPAGLTPDRFLHEVRVALAGVASPACPIAANRPLLDAALIRRVLAT